MNLLRWPAALLCALLWVFANSLAQPLFSQWNVLLFTDAALLLVPARYFPPGPAIWVVSGGTLFADALREGPFGLSATFLLPVLLLMITFRSNLRLRSDGWWLTAITILNSLTYIASATVWTFLQTSRHNQQPLPWENIPLDAAATGILAGAIASSALIFLLGLWFAALQVSMLALLGYDVKLRDSL
jgi:hypothetical protein